MGRFLQTDPIGYADDLNWYVYVGNDPINGMDPTGMMTDGDHCPGGATECPVVNGHPPHEIPTGFAPAVETVVVTADRLNGDMNPNGTNYLRPTPEGPSDDDDDHERARKADFNICRGLMGAALKSACYQSAGQRDYARRNGKPLPPLITQLFSPLPQGTSKPNPLAILGVGGAGAAAACAILEPCGAAVGSALGVTGLGILILQ